MVNIPEAVSPGPAAFCGSLAPTDPYVKQPATAAVTGKSPTFKSV
ncbi:hypothetical protein ABIA70_003953 [Arthrobacter sp. 754]